MSLNAQRESVEGTFQSSVAASYAGTHVKFENAPFKQPETAWFAIHIVDGNSFVTNLGRGKQIDRHVGLVQVDVLAPELSGTKNLITMAEWAGKIWRLQTLTLSDGAVVRYKVPRLTSHGNSNGFHRMSVQVPYWRDEVAQ